MSAPRISRTGSAFDRQLLRAARSESPPEGAEGRALDALSPRPALDGGASTGGAMGVASAIRWGKALGVLGVGLAMVVGGAFTVADANLPSREVPSVHAAVEGAAAVTPWFECPPSPAVSVVLVEAPPTLPSPSAVSATVRLQARPTREARRDVALSSPSTLPEDAPRALASEIDLVQRAARALASDQPRVAGDLLDGYFRSFPRGVLAREAGVLRVRALMADGDATTAARLARALLDEDPEGVLAGPLHAILDRASRLDSSDAARGH